jgi:hypothetical protein
MTRVRDVGAVFHGTEYFVNWCQEFENELGNAGVHDPRYRRESVRYVNAFLAQFVDEDEQPFLGNFMRAEAEALWSLGEQAAAEDRYEALIARSPNFAWGYIGLADCYWLGPEPTPEPKQYAQAVAIYQRARGCRNWKSGTPCANGWRTCTRSKAMPSRLSSGGSKPKGMRCLNHGRRTRR